MRTPGGHQPYKSVLPGGVPETQSAIIVAVVPPGIQAKNAPQDPASTPFSIDLTHSQKNQSAIGFTATLIEKNNDPRSGDGKWTIATSSRNSPDELHNELSVVFVRQPATDETCTMTHDSNGWHCAYTNNKTGDKRFYDFNGGPDKPPHEMSPFIRKANQAITAAMAKKQGEASNQAVQGNIPNDAKPQDPQAPIIHGLEQFRVLDALATKVDSKNNHAMNAVAPSRPHAHIVQASPHGHALTRASSPAPP